MSLFRNVKAWWRRQLKDWRAGRIIEPASVAEALLDTADGALLREPSPIPLSPRIATKPPEPPGPGSETVAASTWGEPPALLTSTSMRPCSSPTLSTSSLQACAVRTSHCMKIALLPFECGRLSGSVRAQTTTVAPAPRKPSAIARPIPLVPPVTMTTLPSKVEPTGCGALFMS